VDRDQQVLAERARGDSLRQIAERHDLSPEGVRLIVVREGRKTIDALEMRLLLNRKTGDVEVYLIPGHGGPEFDLAVDFFQWTLRQLAERGVETKVHYRPVENGVAFGLEDVTDYRGGAA
jgi:hypothetical protein